MSQTRQFFLLLRTQATYSNDKSGSIRLKLKASEYIERDDLLFIIHSTNQRCKFTNLFIRSPTSRTGATELRWTEQLRYMMHDASRQLPFAYVTMSHLWPYTPVNSLRFKTQHYGPRRLSFQIVLEQNTEISSIDYSSKLFWYGSLAEVAKILKYYNLSICNHVFSLGKIPSKISYTRKKKFRDVFFLTHASCCFGKVKWVSSLVLILLSRSFLDCPFLLLNLLTVSLVTLTLYFVVIVLFLTEYFSSDKVYLNALARRLRFVRIEGT